MLVQLLTRVMSVLIVQQMQYITADFVCAMDEDRLPGAMHVNFECDVVRVSCCSVYCANLMTITSVHFTMLQMFNLCMRYWHECREAWMRCVNCLNRA